MYSCSSCFCCCGCCGCVFNTPIRQIPFANYPWTFRTRPVLLWNIQRLVFVGTQLVNLRNLGSTVDRSEIQSPLVVSRVCNLQKHNDCKTCPPLHFFSSRNTPTWQLSGKHPRCGANNSRTVTTVRCSTQGYEASIFHNPSKGLMTCGLKKRHTPGLTHGAPALISNCQ